ncbi:rhodanese-like domain-containing protein [Pseudofrankia sp. DC12]|uniref:rhodanese-like domain-containing protein n=1 Tax=Pseudofrankia sp. DC12 TaxID=683315 RepID=UPI0005F8057E|nr:rhodanese-like domain-containing protein [Pseudofrankia sp. DC12]
MPRYVIVGSGAVGVTLAAELRWAGREVVLVGRGRQLELLRAGQVRYFNPDGSWALDVPAAGGPDEVGLALGDVLVLATKAQQADEVLAEWARQPVAGGAWRAGEVLPVLTVQNGLEAERAALRRFATVVGSVVWVPSTYVADGEVSNPAGPARGVFWLGTYPDGPASAAALEITDDLVAAGFEAQLVTDLSRWKAAKLLGSATFALDALYAPGPRRERAARLVQDEARAVLAAAGYDPADVAPESTLRLDRFAFRPIEGHERGGSSTWQSLARSRDAETDFLNGEIALLARLAGRRAPVNAAVAARVQRAVAERTPPGSLPADDLAQVLAAATVLVDADTLRAELAGAVVPALLDVRWALGDPDGEKHYLDGHLPGAVYVDLDSELAAPASKAAGRHPLPELADLERAARRWGLRAGQPVVVYDDNGGQSAARAWWLLRWAGVGDVRILDGGLAGWSAAGGPVVAGAQRPEPSDIRLSAGHLPVLDADAAAALPASGVLADARGAERYRGEVEPIDSRAGHIPGAVSLPTAANLGADGRFLPVAALRERFAVLTTAADAGEPVGVYCGSGVTAAHEIAALAVAGIDAALYPGSWSAWSADLSRPVATGPGPGPDQQDRTIA